MNISRVSPSRATWLVMTSALLAITMLTLFGPSRSELWEQPQLLFSLVVVAAGIGMIGVTIVIALADRREMAEIGLLGAALMAASVMPLVHGLVTPDVLYDGTDAFHTATFLSLPITVLVALPLLLPHSAFGRWAARHWRDWTLLSLVGIFVLGSVLVFFPDAIVAPGPTDPLTIVVSVAMMVALLSLSLRQARFYELGRQPSNLIASTSLTLLAMSALLPLSSNPYSPGFWWMHLVGALGVLGACIGMGVSQRMSHSAQSILAPVLARDPLAAFELGLSPIVHDFVSDLELKVEWSSGSGVRLDCP